MKIKVGKQHRLFTQKLHHMFIIGFKGGDWYHSMELSLRFENDSYWGRQITLCRCYCTEKEYVSSFTTLLLNFKRRFVKPDRLFKCFPWLYHKTWRQDIEEGRDGMG